MSSFKVISNCSPKNIKLPPLQTWKASSYNAGLFFDPSKKLIRMEGLVNGRCFVASDPWIEGIPRDARGDEGRMRLVVQDTYLDIRPLQSANSSEPMWKVYIHNRMRGRGKVEILLGSLQIVGGIALTYGSAGIGAGFGSAMIGSGISGMGYGFKSGDEGNWVDFAKHSLVGGTTSVLTGGMSMATSGLRAGITSTFSSTFVKQVAHGAVNAGSSVVGSLAGGAIEAVVERDMSKLKEKVDPRHLIATATSGVAGGLAGAHIGKRVGNAGAYAGKTLSSTTTKAQAYGALGGGIAGGTAGAGSAVAYNVAKGKRIGEGVLDAATTGATTGCSVGMSAAKSVATSTFNKVALQLSNDGQVSHYQTGNNLVELRKEQVSEIRALLENTILDDDRKQTLRALLIKGQYKGLNKQEMQYLCGSILSGCKNPEDLASLQAQLKRSINNDGLFNQVISDVIDEKTGMVDPSVCKNRLSSSEILEDLKTYLQSTPNSYFSTSVEADLNKYIEKGIEKADLSGKSEDISINKWIGTGVKLRKIVIKTNSVTFNVSYTEDGKIGINWQFLANLQIHASGPAPAGNWRKTIRDLKIEGKTTLGIAIKDGLMPDIACTTQMKYKGGKIKVAGINITELFKAELKKNIRNFGPKLDQLCKTQGEKAVEEKLIPKIQQEIQKYNSVTSISEGLQVVPNIQKVEYSQLDLRNGKLAVNLRIHGNPAIVDEQLASQLGDLGSSQPVSFALNETVDNVSSFAASTFVSQSYMGKLLQKLVKDGSLPMEALRHRASVTCNNATLGYLSRESFLALIDLRIDIEGTLGSGTADAIGALSGKLFFNPETCELHLINTDFKLENINSDGSVIAFIFKIGSEILQFHQNEGNIDLIPDNIPYTLASLLSSAVSKISEIRREFSFNAFVVKLLASLDKAAIDAIQALDQGIQVVTGGNGKTDIIIQ